MKDLSVLLYPLPEDVEKARTFGDYPRAFRLIRKYLEQPQTPACMKERLRLEEEILEWLPGSYPYTEEEALARVREEIPDFTMEELREWEDNGGADWIYISGTVHLQDRFFESMKKVYPAISERAGVISPAHAWPEETIPSIKAAGGALWHVHMRTSVRMREDQFRPGHVRAWLPVPAECENMKNVKILSASPVIRCESGSGTLSHTVFFEEDLTENRWFTVEYEYDSCVRYTELKPGTARIPENMPVHWKSPQITETPFLRALCEELKNGESDPVIIARNIYDYCTKNVTYSFMREYAALGQIPEYCAAGRKGDCGVQALLFITLCCIAGIPARWQSGLYVTPDDAGNHDWAMFYLEPYGWLFADPSFGGSGWRAGNTEKHEYYFGNLDPFRMAANLDVQCEFEPETAGLRYDPYDSQSGEIERDGEMLKKGMTERRYEVLEMTKIR